MARALPLLPRPKELRATGDRHPLPARVRVGEGAEPPEGGLARARRILAERARGTSGEAVVSRVPAGGAPAGAYRLAIDAGGARVEASEPEGWHAGLATLAQLALLGEGDLPGLEIADRPDLAERGVMLDVSRDRVPTMASLLALAERLGSWKVNRLQLYLEHAFAYEGHETVWRDASPLTPDEARELDRACRDHGIELVPNQNSFGHLHRWLRHARYRDLAECPEGVAHPFSDEREPFSLCPTDPRSLELLADLYDRLLPCFSSRELHVGFDETFDLGHGRSAAACRERGRGRVVLDFLRAVDGLVRDRGRRTQLWADALLEHPEILGELPGDLTACAWGYEAGHPFDARLATLAECGVDAIACPGTSAWCSFGGRPGNALANAVEAAGAAARHGARGLLAADWGDDGHPQPPPISLPGLAFAAETGWNAARAEEARALDWPELLDRHAFDDPRGGTARSVLRLGEIGERCDEDTVNATAPYLLLRFAGEPLPHARLPGVGVGALAEAIDALERLDPRGAPGDERIGAELRWVRDVMRLGCELGLERLRLAPGAPASAIPAPRRRELAARLRAAIEEHRALWLARSRPGGLDDSCARLARPLRALDGAQRAR